MKSATNFSRSGVSDWILQRVSAVILAVYFVVIIGWLIFASEVSYTTWHDFMTCTVMRIFSLLAIVSLAAHAWIGMWTVFTDYLTFVKWVPKPVLFVCLLKLAWHWSFLSMSFGAL